MCSSGPDDYVDAMRKVGTDQDVADASAARDRVRESDLALCPHCGSEMHHVHVEDRHGCDESYDEAECGFSPGDAERPPACHVIQRWRDHYNHLVSQIPPHVLREINGGNYAARRA